MRRSPALTLSLLLLVLLLPLVVLWPLPLIATQRVLAAPSYEAASHIWGLWAADRLGQPLVIHTDLLAWPDGITMVLVDPLNLPAFTAGLHLSGPALGFNLVVWSGLVVAGLAGALLAIELSASPYVGAVAAICAPALVSASGDGLTEDLLLGWVGLQLALLLRFRRTGHLASGLAAGLALGACAWAGPYTALLAGLVDTCVGVAGLRSMRRSPQLSLRAAAVAGVGGVVALPMIWAQIGRDPLQPGGSARGGMPLVDQGTARFRGGLMHGVDLLDAWVPAPLTGGVPDISHTGYLGVVVLLAACLAVYQDRRRWPWLAGALGLSVVALGPHLVLAGRALELDGHPALGPVGLLILAVPAAGRLTRWYRAAAVASLLLAPLAAASVRGHPRRAIVLCVAILADTLLLAPLSWPLPATALPSSSAWSVLADVEEGAILELPVTTSGSPPAGHWRDVGPLAQTLHGRASATSMMGWPPSSAARAGQAAMQGLLHRGVFSAADRSRMRQDGFVLLALHTTYQPLDAMAERSLAACLGDPLWTDPELRLYHVRESASDCPTGEP